MSVCLTVCVSFHLCVCGHDNSESNFSIHLKLQHIGVYENSSDKFDIGHYYTTNVKNMHLLRDSNLGPRNTVPML